MKWLMPDLEDADSFQGEALGYTRVFVSAQHEPEITIHDQSRLFTEIQSLMRGLVRNYEPSDFERVKEIHEASQIDYRLPDFSSPLFLITKVFEWDGVVRMFGGSYLQAELYLIADLSDWATPQERMEAIRELDKQGMEALWLRGIDRAVLWLPPGMERFGERLKDLGFEKSRDGWVTYSKATK